MHDKSHEDKKLLRINLDQNAFDELDEINKKYGSVKSIIIQYAIKQIVKNGFDEEFEQEIKDLKEKYELRMKFKNGNR